LARGPPALGEQSHRLGLLRSLCEIVRTAVDHTKGNSPRCVAPTSNAKVLQEAGVSEGFHLFRHTYASMQFRAGVNILALSKAMGHSKPTVTLDVYGHLMKGDEAPALDALAVASTAAEIASLPVAA
jgi:integrase